MADTGSPLRYAVLGAGAMGTVFGARLALAGIPVELLARNRAHIDAINNRGLVATLDGRSHVLHPRACPAAEAGEADAVIVFTKSHQLVDALGELPPGLANARIVVLANGLGNGERAARVVGEERVVEGITMMPGKLIAPGEVSSSDAAGTWLYAFNGEADRQVERIGADFNHAAIPTSVTPEVRVSIWQKTCFNAAMNALCGLTGGSPGMLQLHSDGRALAHELADEALRVAQAEGVGVSADKVHGLVDYACEHHTWHRPSMLSDLENGKPTEIDAINGYIVAAAARHGIDTPHNSLLLRLVKLRESGPEFWAGEPTGGY